MHDCVYGASKQQQNNTNDAKKCFRLEYGEHMGT